MFSESVYETRISFPHASFLFFNVFKLFAVGLKQAWRIRIEANYRELSQEFAIKVAEDPQEIEKLLKVGFEYVCKKDGKLFFRKRK